MKKVIFKISFLAILFQVNSSFGNMGDISGMVLTPKKPSVFSFSSNSVVKSIPTKSFTKKISSDAVKIASSKKKIDSDRFYPANKKTKLTTSDKIKKSSKKPRIIGNMAQVEGDIKELSVNRVVPKKTISDKVEEVVSKSNDSFGNLISSTTRVSSNAFAVSEDKVISKKEGLKKNTETSFGDMFSKISNSNSDAEYDISIDRLTKAPTSTKRYQPNAFISNTKFNDISLKKELENNYIAQNRYVSPLTLEDVNRESEKGIYKSVTIKNNKNNSKLNILQMKLGFSEKSSALNSRNINNLRNFAGTVLDSPNQGVKVGIGSGSLQSQEAKQLAARRYSILHKILREEGVKEKNIIPVLTSRSEDSFSLNIFDVDNFQTTKRSGGINIFGEEVDRRYYNTLSW